MCSSTRQSAARTSTMLHIVAMTSVQRTRSRPHIGYQVYGGEGPPALFIMGFGMPGFVWKPQVEGLKSSYSCCHYDHLGVGESDPGPQLPTMRSMAKDALRVMNDLGWERAHIVGVSMGGMIAQELALRHEDRCRSLTLIATHAGGLFAARPTLEGLRCFIRSVSSRGEDRVKALERLLYPPDFIETLDPEERRKGTASRLKKPPSFGTVRRHLMAVNRHRSESRLGQLSLPTLLVRPGMDILVRPTQIDRLAKRIPNADIVRFDDAGHGVTFQKAAELNAALRRHFGQADAKESTGGSGNSRAA